MSDGQIFKSSTVISSKPKQHFSWSFNGYFQPLNQHKDTTPRCSDCDMEQDTEYEINKSKNATNIRSKRQYLAFPDGESTKNGNNSSMNLSEFSTGFNYENLQPQTTDIFASKTSDSSSSSSQSILLNEGDKTTKKCELMMGFAEENMIGMKSNMSNEGSDSMESMDVDIDMGKLKVTMMGFENDCSPQIAFKDKNAVTLMGCVEGKISFHINDK